MRKISKEELERILEEHKKWIASEGKEGKRAELCRASLEYANLDNANLKGANLEDANLSGANLEGANLTDANLDGANLYGVNLENASLQGVTLYGANLYGANLQGANLERANLTSANLTSADLISVILIDANLKDADIKNANLIDANLKGAELKDANLYGANFSDVKNMPNIPMIVPETGSFIGWKKAKFLAFGIPTYCIVKLRITEDAKRSSGTTKKCRCSKAEVLSIESLDVIPFDGRPFELKNAYSFYDDSFKYEVGKTVSVNDFDESRFNECSTGIHFFMNREEAVDYWFS